MLALMTDRRFGFARFKRLFVAIVLSSLTGEAFAVERAWTAADVVRLRRVSDAEISPDGARIAYTLSVPRKLNDDEGKGGAAYTELHLLDREGRSRPFITGKVNVGGIKWTPDGQYISFTSKRGEDKESALWAIPADGGEARKVVEHPTGVGAYDWSPDGKRVCFVATEEEPKDRKKEKERGFNQEVFEEDWRPNFLWIAKAEDPNEADDDDDQPSADDDAQGDVDPDNRNSNASKENNSNANAEKNENTNSSDDEKPKKPAHRKLELPGSVQRARWNSDGQRLAVVVARNPGVDAEYMFSRIRIVDVASGKVTQEIENPGKLEQIEWSPNGQRLACISAADQNDPAAGRLMVADCGLAGTEARTTLTLAASKGALQDVVPDLDGDVRAFAWQSPSAILYVADVGVQTQLRKVMIGETVTGIGQAQGDKVVSDLAAGQPVLASISLSDDGQRGAFVASTPQHPPEVFAMNHGDSAPRRLTTSNAWLEHMAIAPQEVVEYAARGGLKLQGILITPPADAAGAKPFPMVMCVHGGPEAHVANGWVTRYSEPGQLLAQEGFAVFYPNYRGSTGRGVEFSKLGQGDAAGKEFDDLVDAVEHFARAGLVDRKKVGVTGGSYGGYATAWCATKLTEHFAAGVMFVGISERVAKSGTTDIPNEEMLVHARKWPWEDWEFHRARSPVTYAPQARTPLLIMHGKDDPRVHPSQSLILYRYLKNIGQVPVRLVWYPGEGHGNRRVAAQFDYCVRVVQWMKHYLSHEHDRSSPPPPFEINYDEKAKDAGGAREVSEAKASAKG